MSREIKFRAWLETDKVMSYKHKSFAETPQYDALQSVQVDGSQIHYIEVDTDGSWGHLVNQSGRFVLMQYTGLHDKNGAEIFEGDIISDQDSMVKPVMEVYWRLESGAWWVRSPIDNGGNELHQYRGWMEVSGNIYENPELLAPPESEKP